jgi:hypothetical protein
MRLRRRSMGLLTGALLLLCGSATGVAETPNPGTPPGGASGALAAATAPRVEIEKETLDLGTVVRGAKAEGTFVLKNLGNDVLKVLSARPG